MSRLYETLALGDTLHLCQATAQLHAGPVFTVAERYQPLLEALYVHLPYRCSSTTQWRCAPGKTWRGPEHGRHVLHTFTEALGGTFQGRQPWDRMWLSAERYVLFCPHASHSHKEWPAEHWQALARDVEELGYTVEWAWSPDRVKRARDLPSLVSAMLHASLVVAVDSGPAHLAAALNAPLLGLYGATSALTYGPQGTRTEVIDTHALAWSRLAHPSTQPYSSARHLPAGAMTYLTVSDVRRQVLSRLLLDV